MPYPEYHLTFISVKISDKFLSSSTIMLYLPTKNDPEYMKEMLSVPVAIRCPFLGDKGKTFHGVWQRCSHAAMSIVDIIKSMPVDMISLISPTATSSLWLSGVILTLQRSITKDEAERETLYSCIGFLLAALHRLGQIWTSAMDLHRKCHFSNYEPLAIEIGVNSGTTLISGLLGGLGSMTTALPATMTFSDILQLLRKWQGPYQPAKTGVCSPLVVTDEAESPDRSISMEAAAVTENMSLEKNCEDLPLNFDFDIFDSTFWPAGPFPFLGSV